MNKLIKVGNQIVEMSFEQAFEQFKNYRYAVFNHWKHLVESINIPAEDLQQEIDIIFYRAFNDYDLNKGNVALTTFTTKYINQKLLNMQRNYYTDKRKAMIDTYSLNQPAYLETESNVYVEFIDVLYGGEFESESIEMLNVRYLMKNESQKKIKIMLLVAEGYQEKEIAEIMGVSKQRVNNIKLEIRNKFRANKKAF